MNKIDKIEQENKEETYLSFSDLSFTTSINKAQGQLFKVVEHDLILT